MLSGQFHLRLPVRSKEMARDSIPLEPNSRYHGTYSIGLLKSCIVLSRQQILLDVGSCAASLTGIFGVIGFHRSSAVHARITPEMKGFRLSSFSIEWCGMDGLLYKIVLAPCDNLDRGMDICRTWERTINSMNFYYGPHDLPIILQERVSVPCARSNWLDKTLGN